MIRRLNINSKTLGIPPATADLRNDRLDSRSVYAWAHRSINPNRTAKDRSEKIYLIQRERRSRSRNIEIGREFSVQIFLGAVTQDHWGS